MTKHAAGRWSAAVSSATSCHCGGCALARAHAGAARQRHRRRLSRGAARRLPGSARHDPRDRPRTGCRWVRLTAVWVRSSRSRARTRRPSSSASTGSWRTAHAPGLKVMVTVVATPVWAQDQSFWQRPPRGFAAGPQGFYAPRCGRDGRLRPRWPSSSPGAIGPGAGSGVLERAQPLDLSVSAARRWGQVLRRPRLSAHAPCVPRGRAPLGSTRPGRRRRHRAGRSERRVPHESAALRELLRSAGAGRYFDAYAHHPYTPGGSVYAAPGRPPNDPTTTVTLYNLGRSCASSRANPST